MYPFLMNVNNEVFHYLSFVDLYQITSISIQNRSMRVMMMMLDEDEPNKMFIDEKKMDSIRFWSYTLLHKALHGIVYNRPEYDPQIQISS